MITILICLILLVVIDAVGDALSYGSKTAKIFSHLLQVGLLVSVGFFGYWLGGTRYPIEVIALSYIFCRLSLFNMVWNIAAGQSITYIGTTGLIDMFFNWLFFDVMRAPSVILLWLYLFSGVASFEILQHLL